MVICVVAVRDTRSCWQCGTHMYCTGGKTLCVVAVRGPHTYWWQGSLCGGNRCSLLRFFSSSASQCWSAANICLAQYCRQFQIDPLAVWRSINEFHQKMTTCNEFLYDATCMHASEILAKLSQYIRFRREVLQSIIKCYPIVYQWYTFLYICLIQIHQTSRI